MKSLHSKVRCSLPRSMLQPFRRASAAEISCSVSFWTATKAPFRAAYRHYAASSGSGQGRARPASPRDASGAALPQVTAAGELWRNAVEPQGGLLYGVCSESITARIRGNRAQSEKEDSRSAVRRRTYRGFDLAADARKTGPRDRRRH